MEQEKYEPTPEELMEAHSKMTPEQKELSAVREIFIESEHRIVELPSDLIYKLDAEVNATGQLYDSFSGTFDGKEIDFRRSSWDKGETWTYKCTANGEDVSQEEAMELWGKTQPALVAFERMQSSEMRALGQLREGEVGTEREQKEKVSLAHEQGFVEGEQIGKIKGVLEKRIEEIETTEEDSEFLKNVLEQVVQLYSSPKSSQILTLSRLKIVNFDPEEENKRRQHSEYDRRAELLKRLLGAKEPQKWVAGFGVSYAHSNVYETIFRDMILRECYDRRELGEKVDAELIIEKDSKFQKRNDN